MATQVNYAASYQSALERAFSTENSTLTSSDLWNSPSNGRVTFDGAKHIKVPKLQVLEGRRDRGPRRSIDAHRADYSNDWITYELTQDRYWSTDVDPVDIDESNMIVTIGKITDTFNRDEKIPEMDRYMYSQLFKQKQAKGDAKGIHDEKLTASNILEAFDNMMANFDEARIPQQNRVLYITPQTNRLLKQADAKNRAAVISGNGKVDRMVYSLDDVTINVVPSDLMQTEFDFTVGSKPIDSAKQIDMFLIYNGIQIAPQKYSFVGLDAPSAGNAGNYLYYERSYFDVIMLDSKTDGYEAYVSDKSTPKAAGSSK